jgi:hypothetical protein
MGLQCKSGTIGGVLARVVRRKGEGTGGEEGQVYYTCMYEEPSK